MPKEPSRTCAAASSNRREVTDVSATPAEAALAHFLNHLGNGALAGEFRREWPVGDWVVDFYFPGIRLAIEVDGGYHRALSRWRRDLHKTRDLEARGITVLRLCNAEVLGDRERLIARLRLAWRTALQRMAQNAYGVREAAPSPYLPCYSVRGAASPAVWPDARRPGLRSRCLACRQRRASQAARAPALRLSGQGRAAAGVWWHPYPTRCC